MIISSKMAASIYATPPPDLSSEDTALSDVSNSSTLNTNRNNHNHSSSHNHSHTSGSHSNSSSNNPHEAAGATPTATTAASRGATGVEMGGNSPTTAHLVNAMELELEPKTKTKPAGSGTNEAMEQEAEEQEARAKDAEEAEDVGDANMATMAAAMQLQLLEALSDAAKKRRKQHNPSRLEALNLSGEPSGEAVGGGQRRADSSTEDYEDKLSKMFLPKSIEQLKETFEMLQYQQKQQQQEEHTEPEAEMERDREAVAEAETEAMTPDISEGGKQRENPYHTYCKQCGESFETEFKLSLHMLQDHGEERSGEQDPADFLASIKVKLERAEIPSPQQEHHMQQELTNGHGKDVEREQEQEHWFQAMQAQHHPHGPQMPPAFPFPPEAALGPAGYLPLLGMSGFPGVDGLNRPPLRIFNPEAYCELCNKEFCNKYFLKTHKANKHGIFDPVGESNNSTNTSSHHNNNNNNNITSSNNNTGGHPNPGMSSMGQMFQLQREAQVAKQDVSQGGGSSNPVASVHCDICSKRFTNIFAMRRHRAKQHDAQPGSQDSPNSQTAMQSQSLRGSPNEQPVQPATIKQEMPQESEVKPYQLPEGFREDFTLEQEELSFVPPPRKLPSHLHQQAKDSNFNAEKLRRLGVQFPEFFCELCFKEYANRYFLRTHKWKRHGLFVPPEEVTPQPGGKDEAQMPSAWPFMPLNLMLAKAAAATLDQQDQEREPETETEAEQPSKRIKLEQEQTPPENYDEEKLNGSVVGLQNLQKLQSMLQQLNDINGKRPLPCHLCGQEQENQYALRAHLMTEHAGQMQLPMPIPMPLPDQQAPHPMVGLYPQTPPTSGARSPPGVADLRCQQCDRDFASAQEFKQHIAEVHMGRNGVPLGGSPLREGFFTPERPVAPPAGAAGNPGGNPPGNRPAYTLTPTSSYCEICNKELCNKYFMKTHMQRMHGIEIENGAQIGGVVCNICNKELCSKYFLRVHKHNTHGIIEEGSPLPQPRGQNGVKMEAAAAAAAAVAAATPQQDQELNVSPTTVEGSSSTGGSNHEVCPLCSRQFRSFKWLRSHLMNEHGSAGVERLREMDTTGSSTRSKPNSPTLKIPNGSGSNPSAAAAAAGAGNSAPNLAQALQNLNAQHLFGQMQQQQQMPKMPPLPIPGMFGEQAGRFKEYQCSLCPFTTPYYAFLFIHERSHALLNNGGEAMELPVEPPAPPISARNPGKSRSKSSKSAVVAPLAPVKSEEPEAPLEPTNLSTSAPKVAAHSPSAGAGSPPAYSTKATSSTSPKIQRRRSSSKPPTTPNGLGSGGGTLHRSAATSPFEGCGELANGSGKPASYAQPDRTEEAYQMQAFHLQPADPDSEMQFAPALVYLPVRVRASESATLSFRLTPA
ncbi:LOW QUALITY PROTEIN: uncharacterized protein LOC108099926 [Drosophila ficusphila]|uniref:LOW QUALITY PROTEIN: uncharacterized protein LOC108099926 n=1 Tax=Drosophila ficusphila TaxID=30025 RepID=UPI0007E6FEE3|nr:LOW QUALITY PROTEIN: uncharacterized protein LOC108099926 [Drosophila ficusphila]